MVEAQRQRVDLTGDPASSDVAEGRRAMAEFVWRLRRGSFGSVLDWDFLDGYRYSGRTARAIARGASRQELRPVLQGEINGDLNLGVCGDLYVAGTVRGDLRVEGTVNGDLHVLGTVTGDLHVEGTVTGNLHVRGTVTRDLSVGGTVTGDLSVEGTVTGNLYLFGTGTVTGTISVESTSTVAGNLYVFGTVTGDLYVEGTVTDNISVFGTVAGDLYVEGTVTGDLSVGGTVAGNLYVLGTVTGNLSVGGAVTGSLYVGGTVAGNLHVLGTITGNLSVGGTVAGNLYVLGSVTGNLSVGRSAQVGGDLVAAGVVSAGVSIEGAPASLHLVGSFQGRVVVSPPSDAPVVALRSVRGAEFSRAVFIGDRVSIAGCDFRQCPDLDRLELVGADLFMDTKDGEPIRVRELLRRPWGADESIPPSEMASIDRQLRANLEGRSNRPAASVFYRGEMNARCDAAKASSRWSLEYAVLTVYRIVAEYGLSVARPLATFGAVAIVGTFAFEKLGLSMVVDNKEVVMGRVETFTFTVRSMLSFFNPPDAGLPTAGIWVQMGLRLVGPLLLAAALLAVRDRVAR